MTGIYHLRLLGPVEVTRDGKPVRGFVSRKALALLGYLIARRQPFPRSYLADLFWPDTSEARGRGSLSRVLSNLSRLLPGCVKGDYHSVWLQARATCWLDTTAFEELLGQENIPALTRAIDLYRGDFMANISLGDCPDFSAWLAAEQQRWRQRASSLFHCLAIHYSDRREFQRALELSHRWLELEPWQEEAHRQLMLLLTRAGRRSAALAQYETCRHVLAEELGVEPAAETVALYERIRGVGDRPPHNLPAQPTPFVGREAELADLDRLIRDPHCRLLALVGPGGIGKTRLALQAALEVTRSPIALLLHGVYVVPLAAITSAELLPGAIADALQLSLYGAAEPKVKLLKYLRDRELLLLLDNFEQLLPEGAALLVEILQQAPGVKLMVTSRAYLNLRWEWRFPVQGLPVADVADQPGPNDEAPDAIQVFLNVARRVHLPFVVSPANQSVVTQICQLLEGIPLGIELAASWVHEHSCASIVREIEHNLDFLSTSLHDVSKRHRSLRAVFDYSWALLSAEEQGVFSRLSVFRGGFTPEAAEQVVGATAAILTSLLNKSLLRQSATRRFEMHELLRQYGLEKLKQIAETYKKNRDAHCAYYTEFIQQRDLTQGGKQKENFSEITVEIDNVRAGWYWAIERGRIKEIEKAAEGLWAFYEMRGWFQEGEKVFRRAATALQSRVEPLMNDTAALRVQNYVVGHLLNRQAWFCWRLNLLEKARQHLQQALSILHQAGPDAQREISFTLNQLGGINWDLGDFKQARSHLQKSLEIARTVGDAWLVTTSLQFIGFTAQSSGQYAEAKQRYLEAYKNSQEVNDRTGILLQTICLGNVAYLQEEYAKARSLLKDGLTMAKEMGYQYGIAFALHNLGVVAYITYDYEDAKQLLQESFKLLEQMDDRRQMALSLTYQGYIANVLKEYKDARKHLYDALEMALPAKTRAVALAALVGIAELLKWGGQPERAVELLTLVLHHSASEQETKDRAQALLEELKTQLSGQALAAAQRRGKAGELERVAGEILAEPQRLHT